MKRKALPTKLKLMPSCIVAMKVPLLAAMLMIVEGILPAQEMVIELAEVHGTSAMVRMVDENDWMVYTKDSSCRLLRVKPGNTSVDEMSPPSYVTSVSDMEVADGKLYFCGMTSNNVPYMANCDISAFPSTTFEIETLAEASRVNKLEVLGNSASTVHVIMTGQDLSGYGMIIEAMSTSAGWHIYYCLVYDEKGRDVHH